MKKIELLKSCAMQVALLAGLLVPLSGLATEGANKDTSVGEILGASDETVTHGIEKAIPAIKGRKVNMGADVNCTVTKEPMAEQPISPKLCGNFIEMGYGQQEDNLWAEMFFNRRFERFIPYNSSTYYWYGLLETTPEGKKEQRKDWRPEPWYHSGYEHNAWFAAPGSEPEFRMDASTTLFVRKGKEVAVELSPLGDPSRGVRGLRISNRESGRWAGLGQQGKFLRKGIDYRFSGQFRNAGNAPNAEILFFKEGQWEEPLQRLPLKDISDQFSTKRLEFANPDFEGRVTFALFIPPNSSLEVDDFSLMPSDAQQGWRKDVIEALKAINPSVMRWPGGCFASYYDWRAGVGPRELRKAQPSWAWGGLVGNDIGTLEMAALAEQVGFEPMFCINMFHPRKAVPGSEPPAWPGFKNGTYFGYPVPDCRDPNQGIQLAADWVAYCNAPVSHPMGRLRAEHGHPAPLNVKYWELDNETFRWFNESTGEGEKFHKADGLSYAKECVKYARAMKGIDPAIRIGMVSYGWGEQLPEMMRIAGEDVDFLADRGLNEVKEMAPKIQMLRQHNAEHPRKLRYANTEWLCWGADPYTALRRQQPKPATLKEVLSSWGYALSAGNTFLMWQRYGGDVEFTNFNNLVNTAAQSAMEAFREGVQVDYAGYVLGMFSRSKACWPLKLNGYTPNQYGVFQVQAAWDQKREKLVLYAVNCGPQTRRADFNLQPLGRDFRTAAATTLSAPESMSMRTVKTPTPLTKKTDTRSLNDSPGKFAAEVPAFTLMEVVLE